MLTPKFKFKFAFLGLFQKAELVTVYIKRTSVLNVACVEDHTDTEAALLCRDNT